MSAVLLMKSLCHFHLLPHPFCLLLSQDSGFLFSDQSVLFQIDDGAVHRPDFSFFPPDLIFAPLSCLRLSVSPICVVPFHLPGICPPCPGLSVCPFTPLLAVLGLASSLLWYLSSAAPEPEAALQCLLCLWILMRIPLSLQQTLLLCYHGQSL